MERMATMGFGVTDSVGVGVVVVDDGDDSCCGR